MDFEICDGSAIHYGGNTIVLKSSIAPLSNRVEGHGFVNWRWLRYSINWRGVDLHIGDGSDINQSGGGWIWKSAMAPLFNKVEGRG